MFRLISFIIAASFFFGSCQNCVCLPSDGLRLGMISFTSSDIDTIIIRKFDKGSNFTHLIDTMQWDRSNVIFNTHADTSEMGIIVGDLRLKSKFDYQVFFPAIARTYKITEINEPQREEHCPGKTMCVNSIVSSKLDESTLQISSGILYLKK